MCGSHFSICTRTSSSTSDGENCLPRYPASRSTALRSCSGVTASSAGGLCMGVHRETGFNDAGEHARTDRDRLVVEHIAGIVDRYRSLVTEPEIGAGHRMQHIGEILAAH